MELEILAEAPLVAGALGPEVLYATAVRRLGPELYLLIGRGSLRESRLERRVGRVVWMLDPGTRVGAWTGTVELGVALVTDETSRLTGTIGAAVVDTTQVPGIGLLTESTLLSAARPVEPGTYSPGPTTFGSTCVTDRLDNWGSPTDPEGPCGSHRPLLGSTGSLCVKGGEGQGVLVVSGDLTITEGAWFEGILLVGGDLRLEAGSTLVGLCRVAGEVEMVGGAAIDDSRHKALRALEASGLDTLALPVPGGSWISLF
jgi:hypothetical protein